MWNRWQDPTTGRFLSEDPARDGENWYAYVGNNPLTNVDPTGLLIVLADGTTKKQTDQFNEAISYIQRSPTAKSMIERLQKSPEVFTVAINSRGDVGYDQKANAVKWDPTSGLELRSGKIQTPALGLAHELGHALQDLAGFLTGKSRDAIEQDNLEKTETPIAEELKEPVRQVYWDSKSNPETKGPTSAELAAAKTSDTKSSGSGSGSGAKSSKIICAELHRQGLMPESIFIADEQFGLMMTEHFSLTMKGYTILANPIVRAMKNSKSFTLTVAGIVKPWSIQMAYMMKYEERGDFVGLIMMILGILLCTIVGFVSSVDLVVAAATLFVGFVLLQRWARTNSKKRRSL